MPRTSLLPGRGRQAITSSTCSAINMTAASPAPRRGRRAIEMSRCASTLSMSTFTTIRRPMNLPTGRGRDPVRSPGWRFARSGATSGFCRLDCPRPAAFSRPAPIMGTRRSPSTVLSGAAGWRPGVCCVAIRSAAVGLTPSRNLEWHALAMQATDHGVDSGGIRTTARCMSPDAGAPITVPFWGRLVWPQDEMARPAYVLRPWRTAVPDPCIPVPPVAGGGQTSCSRLLPP